MAEEAAGQPLKTYRVRVTEEFALTVTVEDAESEEAAQASVEAMLEDVGGNLLALASATGRDWDDSIIGRVESVEGAAAVDSVKED